jgi:selenocysteine lyase/cysteine desulfurase
MLRKAMQVQGSVRCVGTAACSAIDVVAARKDTDGCTDGSVQTRIHLNAAGAALMPKPVVKALTDHIRLETLHGGYEAQDAARDTLKAGYNSIASLLNCAAHEIAMVESATIAWQKALYSVPLQPNDRILTTHVEYGANFVSYMQLAARTGAVVEVIPHECDGDICVSSLRQLLEQQQHLQSEDGASSGSTNPPGPIKLIAITHIPTNNGIVVDAKAVGALAREFGVLYLLDACQSVGQLSVDVQELQCDMLSATGRKYLRGPRGTGFLYVRGEVMKNRLLEPPAIDHYGAPWTAPGEYTLRDDAVRYETWECSVASRLGLKVAVDYALNLGLDRIEERVCGLAGLLRLKLQHLQQQLEKAAAETGAAGEAEAAVTTGAREATGQATIGTGKHQHQHQHQHRLRLTCSGKQRCGIVGFSVEGMEASVVRGLLRQESVNVTVSPPSSTLLDAIERQVPDVVRASLHYYNTEEEVERFVATLAKLLSVSEQVHVGSRTRL